MSIEEMRYIRAICRFRNMTRAAADLHISVQGLSQSIRRLEKEKGIRLFNRTNKGAEPTEACLAMLGDIEAALSACDAADRKLEEVSQTFRETLRVGVDSSPLSLTMLDIAYRYANENGVNLEEVDLRKFPPDPDEMLTVSVDLMFLRGRTEREYPGYSRLLISQNAFELVGSKTVCAEFADRKWSALDGKTVYFTALAQDHPDYLMLQEKCREAGARTRFQELPLDYMLKQLHTRKDTAACIFRAYALQAVEDDPELWICPTPEKISGKSEVLVSDAWAERLAPVIYELRQTVKNADRSESHAS